MVLLLLVLSRGKLDCKNFNLWEGLQLVQNIMRYFLAGRRAVDRPKLIVLICAYTLTTNLLHPQPAVGQLREPELKGSACLCIPVDNNIASSYI